MLLSKIIKLTCYNWMYRHSGIDCFLSSYLTATGIIIHHVKFEIDRTILTCLNYQKEMIVMNWLMGGKIWTRESKQNENVNLESNLPVSNWIFTICSSLKQWIYNIHGYYDRGKIVVNLGFYHGHHLVIRSFIQ